MSVVLDTTVLIDILRGRSEARGFYLGLREGPVCSELTRLEVLRGMRSDERSPTFRLLASLQWHPVDREVSTLAGQLGREYRASHRGIGAADLAIAATALVRGASLATSNVKDFPMFPDLVPAY